MQGRYQGFIGLVLCAIAGFAHGNNDTVFASGVEPGFTIQGRVYWPGPVSGAVVTARYDDRVATATSRADGTFGLVIEYRNISGTPLIELRARGSGAQSHIEYAGQLGPFDRLQDAAGDDETLSLAEEAFVNLTPYSTVITAYMRAEGGYGPVVDVAAFERASRSLQIEQAASLTLAIALAAQGDLALPAGKASTWEALSDLLSSQRFMGDYWTLAYGSDCVADPQAPSCTISADLFENAMVIPAVAPVPGALHAYSNGGGFDYAGIGYRMAFSLNGSAGHYQDQLGSPPRLEAVAVRDEGDNIFSIYRGDGSPLRVLVGYAFINGQQVLRHTETIEFSVRFSHTVGNLVAVSTGAKVRWHHPNNPEVPDQHFDFPISYPQISINNPMPETQSGDLGALSGGRWMMTTPFGLSPALDADIHVFAGSGGNAERGGQAFALVDQQADRFTLDYGTRQVDVHLVNQDLPGIWRTRLMITSGADTAIASGVLLKVDSPQPDWTAAIAPGLYRGRINGYMCDGPWAELDHFNEWGSCSPLGAWRGFQINSDGTASMGNLGVGTAMSWNLPGGSDQGRLHVYRMVGESLQQSRGWEIVKVVGNRYWIMENAAFGGTPPLPGPVTFSPTSRLYALDRQ